MVNVRVGACSYDGLPGVNYSMDHMKGTKVHGVLEEDIGCGGFMY